MAESRSVSMRAKSGTREAGFQSLSIRGMEIAPEAAGPYGQIEEAVFISDKKSLSDFNMGPTMVDLSDHGHMPGQSSWVSGVFHLITVMIGAGVLSLPSSFALLGWALGPALLLVFGGATVWSSYHLSETFEVDGKKYFTYKDMVAGIMGGYHPPILAGIQYLNMFLSAVGYTLAGTTSINYIASTACSTEGSDPSDCPLTATWSAIITFSGLQVVLNMLPNLESIWWVSAVGAGMSYLYSALAMALSSQHLATVGMAQDTTAFGKEASTSFLRAIGMFGGLGNLLFAWSSGLMLPAIQATLKEPPKSSVSMQKTIVASYGSTALFYFAISCLGYAALGSGVPGDVLTGFNVSKEVELVANSAVLFHMIAAVQVYMHPIYEAIELSLHKMAPKLVTGRSTAFLLVLRFSYRFICTAAITGVGYGLPHFSLISGLNGALTFWPLQIFYPFSMYLRVHNPEGWVRNLMLITALFILAVSIMATIGSFYALATA